MDEYWRVVSELLAVNEMNVVERMERDGREMNLGVDGGINNRADREKRREWLTQTDCLTDGLIERDKIDKLKSTRERS